MPERTREPACRVRRQSRAVELTRAADRLRKAELAPVVHEDVAPLRTREAELTERLADLGEAFAAGEITRETMRAG